MTEEQQFVIFKKFIKGEIVISDDIKLILRDGLYDKPKDELTDMKEVIFDLKANDESVYSDVGLNNYIWEIIETFEKLIDESLQFDFKIEFGGQPNYNIGFNFKRAVDDKLKNVTEIFMSSSAQNKKITLQVEHVETGFSFHSWKNESADRLHITNYVKVNKAFENGNEISIEDGIDEYKWFIDRRPYDDSDNNYLEIDHLMDEYKVLSSESMITFVTTGFV
jgi:hypothetical protein